MLAITQISKLKNRLKIEFLLAKWLLILITELIIKVCDNK